MAATETEEATNAAVSSNEETCRSFINILCLYIPNLPQRRDAHGDTIIVNCVAIITFFLEARRVRRYAIAPYSSFQLGDQTSTAEGAEGRRGWLIVLLLCVPLLPLRLVILFIQAKYAVKL